MAALSAASHGIRSCHPSIAKSVVSAPAQSYEPVIGKALQRPETPVEPSGTCSTSCHTVKRESNGNNILVQLSRRFLAGDDAQDMGQGGVAVPPSQMRLMPPLHATQVAPVQRAAPGVRALDKFRQLGHLALPFASQV